MWEPGGCESAPIDGEELHLACPERRASGGGSRDHIPENDPHELQDLGGHPDHEPVRQQMRATLLAWAMQHHSRITVAAPGFTPWPPGKRPAFSSGSGTKPTTKDISANRSTRSTSPGPKGRRAGARAAEALQRRNALNRAMKVRSMRSFQRQTHAPSSASQRPRPATARPSPVARIVRNARCAL